MRRFAWMLGVLMGAVAAGGAGAQGSPLRDITGRVTGPDGRGIASVLVRAQQGDDVREARSDSLGQYRVIGVWAGTWTVTTRRIGYVSDSASVRVIDAGLRHDRQLVPAATRVGAQVITAAWAGVRGVVGDRTYQPLSGATVELVGREVRGAVSPEGTFALPHTPGAPVLLRVRAPGHETRLVSARVPADGSVELSVELSVLLDVQQGNGASLVVADELDMRMAWSSPLSAYLTREDVLESGTRDLRLALELAPAVNRKGLRVDRTACVFVDGLPRPGMPIDAFNPEQVEFVEMYAGAADRSGLLARRWPARGACGNGGTAMRTVGNTQSVQYIVLWLRHD